MHSFLKTSLIAFAIFLGGCGIVPDPIDVADNENLATFDSIINGNGTGEGLTARWGGEIIAVENKKDFSEFEILQYPNNHYGKPRTTLDSQGRFKVRVSGFIDPLVFAKGRSITFVGEVGEPAEGIIGEQTYVYPVLLANGYYLWKETEEYRVSGFMYSELSPFWGMGIRRDYWGSYGYYHNRATIRVKTKSSKSSNNGSAGNSRSHGSDSGTSEDKLQQK